MKPILLITSAVVSFIGMELASWFIHKYIMHGPLWNIHKTHHQHSNSPLELNDLFSLFFGGISVVLIVWGLNTQNPFMSGTGLGIALYGLVYFILHDLFIHRRIKMFRKSRSPYLNALAEAHRDHHKSREKEPGTSFGLLWVNRKYFQKHYQRHRKEEKS